MSKKFNKFQDVNLGNLIKRIVHDAIYRARWSLTFSMIWSVLMFGYYLALAIVDTVNQSGWSWYYGLSLWYLTFAVFKIILVVNLFSRIKNKKWIDFKLLAIIFLFISFAESLFVAFTPIFFRSAFKNKLNRGLKIVTIIINCINVVFFGLSFWPVKREDFTKNEADFIITKHYVSRMGGIFNLLIIIINALLFFNLQETYPWVLILVYMVVSLAFAGMSLALAIKMLIKRKWDVAHSKANIKQAKAKK